MLLKLVRLFPRFFVFFGLGARLGEPDGDWLDVRGWFIIAGIILVFNGLVGLLRALALGLVGEVEVVQAVAQGQDTLL